MRGIIPGSLPDVNSSSTRTCFRTIHRNLAASVVPHQVARQDEFYKETDDRRLAHVKLNNIKLEWQLTTTTLLHSILTQPMRQSIIDPG